MASCSLPPQEAEDLITDLQKELFKAQGIEGGWGIQCLGQVGDTYQDDTDFMKLFVTAVERCSSSHPWQHLYMYAYQYVRPKLVGKSVSKGKAAISVLRRYYQCSI